MNADLNNDRDFATLARIIAEKHRMSEIQGELIAEARKDARESDEALRRVNADLRRTESFLSSAESALVAFESGRDAALATAEMNARAGAAHAAEVERLRHVIDRLNAEYDRMRGELAEIKNERDEAQGYCSGIDAALLRERSESDARYNSMAAGRQEWRHTAEEALRANAAATDQAERLSRMIVEAEASRDEAREQRDDCAATVDKLRAELHAERAEAQAVVAELKSEVDRLGVQRDEERDDKRDLRGLLARVYIGADSRTMKRREIAELLAPLFPPDQGPMLQAECDPATAPGHEDLMLSPEEINAYLDTNPPPALPPGFVSIDLDTLPPHVAARIRADAPKGATFVEVDAARLPDNIIRRIFAIAPDGGEPVQVAENARGEVAA